MTIFKRREEPPPAASPGRPAPVRTEVAKGLDALAEARRRPDETHAQSYARLLADEPVLYEGYLAAR